MLLVHLIIDQPLVTIQMQLLRGQELPHVTNTVIPLLQDGLVLIQVRVAWPALENPETSFTVEKGIHHKACHLAITGFQHQPEFLRSVYTQGLDPQMDCGVEVRRDTFSNRRWLKLINQNWIYSSFRRHRSDEKSIHLEIWRLSLFISEILLY